MAIGEFGGAPARADPSRAARAATNSETTSNFMKNLGAISS